MRTPDPSIWREICAYLRRYHGDVCRQWFEELEPIDLSSGRLTIRVPTDAQRYYLSQCSRQFQEAAQTVTGALVAVSFISGDDGHAMSVGPPRPDGSQAGQQAFLDDAPFFLSPDYTFENFITGPGNRLAYAAAVAVAEQPAQAYNPLFIHGGVGLGKTHLLQAIGQNLHRHWPDARICYLSCDSFMHQFLEAVQNGQMHEFRHRYRHVDLLLIDDIHFLSNRERTQEEFFHTFNTLYQSGRQLVLSSDSTPNEIPQLEERLVSRFNWGLVASIDTPSYETRIAIIHNKARLRGVHVPDDVVCYVASAIESNARELEGALTKLQSLAMVRGVPITMEVARQALGEEDDSATLKMPQVTVQDIIDLVTQFYGIKVTDLLSKKRHRSISIPRQVCMYLARQCTRYSLEEIGGYFGGRDHTTVLHAIRAVHERQEVDVTFATQVKRLEDQLSGS